MAAPQVQLIIHPKTGAEIEAFVAEPTHALLLTGAKGSGKSAVAQLLALRLIGSALTEQAFTAHPYIRIIRSEHGKAISIETIRELQHFLTLKIPGQQAPGSVSRIVIVEDAGLMTTEAQNALLKTLEEPPEGTVLILLATSHDAVLPTIRSRVRQLAVLTPGEDILTTSFIENGHGRKAVESAVRISGGLPGLTYALLTEDQQHPLFIATTHARGILQSKTYERLLLVDSLSKQKDLCLDVLYVLGRMAHMALARSGGNQGATEHWKRILKAAFDAERQLGRSVQTKLVLTNFMLAL